MKSFIVLAAAASVSTAEVPVMPDEYTLLCDGEKATGFNWRSGGWVETTFRPGRHIVTRKQSNKCLFDPVIDQSLKEHSAFFFTRDVCLNVRDFGDQYKAAISFACTEYYVRDAAGRWNREFSCDDAFLKITGVFDGWFQRHTTSTVTTNPTNDTRDSLIVEVGKCSVVS